MAQRPEESRLTREFLERRDDPAPGLSDADAAAMRFVRSWHRFPALHENVWYRGISLGEVLEWALIPEVIAALAEDEDRQDR